MTTPTLRTASSRMSPTAVPGPGQVWPIKGRDGELDAVDQLLGATDGVRGLLLAGASGVGKTRLAREALSLARRRGAATAWAAATASATPIPLGALSHLLPPLDSGVDDSGQPSLRQVTAALLADQRGARVVLAVDDAHLLDDTSAALLHQIALTGAASLVLTVRRGEPAPGAIVALWKDELVRRIEVQPLTRAAASDLISTILGGPLDSASQEALYRVTGGNPTFLLEVVQGARDAGQLEERWGVWNWRGRVSPTSRLTDLVKLKLERLSPDERSLVDVLAFGEPLGASIAAGISSWDTLSGAETKGLVTVENDGRRCQVRLAHPLYAEVIRAATPPLRARWARATLCARQGGRLRRRGDVLRQATLQLDGEGRGDPELLLAAAAQATWADPVVAERMAAAALEADAGFRGRMAMGVALDCQGRRDEAEAAFAQASGVARTDEERAEASLMAARLMFWGRGAGEAADALLKETELAVTRSQVTRRLTALRSSFALFAGRLPAALEIASPLLVPRGGSDLAALRAGAVSAHGLARCGRAADALAASDRSRLALSECEDAEGFESVVVHSQIVAQWLAGHLGEAEDRASVFYEQCLARPNRGKMPVACLLVGQLALARGRAATAVRHLKEAVGGLLDSDPSAWLLWSLLSLGEAMAVMGDPDEARIALARAATIRRPTLRLWDADAVQAEAWVAAARGELTGAVSQAKEAASAAAEAGQSTIEAVCLHAVVRFGHRDPAVTERLKALELQSDSSLVAALCRHATAFDDMDGPELDGSAATFAAMGASLLAAEAANQAAVVHRRMGRRGSAMASADRARDLAAACEGARTPALEQQVDHVRLTRREREVGGLAARGLSNRSIAERLVVSVRTVEGHLEQVYAKLGVHSREDLARLLTPVPETPLQDPKTGSSLRV